MRLDLFGALLDAIEKDKGAEGKDKKRGGLQEASTGSETM
jgi:hypothetical protein